MNSHNNNDDRLYWVGWVVDKAPILLLLGLLVCAGGFILFAVRFDRRLEDIQSRIDDQLHYRPPAVAGTDDADESPVLDASAQRVTYVPAHSHVYHGEGQATPLTVTLSIRNPNAAGTLVVSRVDYFNTQGQRIKSFVDMPIRVKPLATIEYLVGESDVTGGSGASFLVDWSVPDGANDAIIDAVMIGNSGGLGISFVQRGQELIATGKVSS